MELQSKLKRLNNQFSKERELKDAFTTKGLEAIGVECDAILKPTTGKRINKLKRIRRMEMEICGESDWMEG